MTLFWIIAASLTALVAAMIATPLMRRQGEVRASDAQAAQVYRDQLKEIDRDLAAGLLSGREADAARTEVARRLLALLPDDAEAAEAVSAPMSRWPRHLGFALVLLVPAAALAFYLPIGRPDLPGQPLASREMPGHTQETELAETASELNRMLEADPDNLENWVSLARTYQQMGRFRDATEAFRRSIALSEGDPRLVNAFGESLVMASEGTVVPQARQAFQEVLASDPDNPGARFYLALHRLQSGDVEGALDRWLDLARDAPPDAPWLETLDQRVREAAQRLGRDGETLMAEALADRGVEGTTGTGTPPERAEGPMAPDAPASQDGTGAATADDPQEVADTMRARLNEDPQDLEAWLRLAQAEAMQGDTDAAREALGHAAELAPERTDIQLAYAEMILEAEGRSATAGRPSGVGDQAGDAASALPDPFIETMRRVDEHDPGNPQALWFLGIHAVERGDTEEARDRWATLLELLDPDSQAHAEVRRRLDAL